jgi:hypothetical protein
VYVHDLDVDGACENAENTLGGYDQDTPYCTFSGSVWHDFCACHTRRGVVSTYRWWFFNDNTTTEPMSGHQTY